MRIFGFTFFLLCSVLLRAQPVFPPVPGGDVEGKDYGLWSNTGWLLDTDGDPRPDVQFVTEGASPRTYIRKEATMSFTVTTVDSTPGGTDTLRRVDMELVGELAAMPDAIGSSARTQWHNYYLPHCGPNGVTNVTGYNRVVYPGIYPNIDLWVFSGYYGQKMMFVVQPGGDPTNILMKFTGQDQLDVDANGWLRMLLQDRWITLPEAVAYQFDQNNTIITLQWTASYTANNGSGFANFNFDVYDPTKPLVLLIGPPPPMGGGALYDETGLCWSTYLGDDGNDYAEEVRLDADDNLYVTGRTSSTLLQFPAFPGIVYATSGNRVAFMTKFDALHQLSWTLFYGGSLLGPPSEGNAIAIKEGPVRRIYMVGRTQAQDLQTVPNGSAYLDATNASATWKGFIAVVDDQTSLLTWATYFGEHDVEIRGADISGSNLVICGTARNDLPAVQYGPPPGSLNQAYAGATDAFVAMFDGNDQLFWRSWWGGPDLDIALAVRAAPNKIVMAGHTLSGSLNMINPGNGAYSQSFGGGQEVYLIEFDLNGVVQWSTYLGGNGIDQLGLKGLDIDDQGDVFLCGKASDGLMMVPGPFWYDDVYNGGDGFIARFSGLDRSPLWITYLGAASSNMPMAIMHGSDDRINVVGYTNDTNFPHVTSAGLYDQSGAFESCFGAFLVQFRSNQLLVHSTWFGGDGGTCVTWARALDVNGDGVYVTGHTYKTNDPLAYFPLDDGQGLSWFDGEYNHLGQSVQGTDGFLTLFCEELITGLDSEGPGQILVPTVYYEHGELILWGLADGRIQMDLFDSSGRLLRAASLYSNAGRSVSLPVGSLAPGVYILRAELQAVLKFIVP